MPKQTIGVAENSRVFFHATGVRPRPPSYACTYIELEYTSNGAWGGATPGAGESAPGGLSGPGALPPASGCRPCSIAKPSGADSALPRAEGRGAPPPVDTLRAQRGSGPAGLAHGARLRLCGPAQVREAGTCSAGRDRHTPEQLASRGARGASAPPQQLAQRV